ncbi:ribonuclease Z [Mesonia aestuariivivens]|uniref:Ribonuclease Z n=1 Tax=Mesonia aestuariivivens TaxID=2796128 RepID=A0ABS6VYG3_9FLAO|nr:ribonuclease Z [Mesonia aestuariivivens]MBW2960621.1 ribonuclease Z [Mesonia aestuariivivens]
MKLTEKENYSIVEDDKNEVAGFSNYLENHAYDKIKDKNIVVDISKYGELTLKELLSFLQLSNQHRANNHSFVIVNDTINIDHIPEELMVVPTLLEAGDVIQMDEIQRDLGGLDEF